MLVESCFYLNEFRCTKFIRIFLISCTLRITNSVNPDETVYIFQLHNGRKLRETLGNFEINNSPPALYNMYYNSQVLWLT